MHDIQHEETLTSPSTTTSHDPILRHIKQFLPHERCLLLSGSLQSSTHPNYTSLWLSAPLSPQSSLSTTQTTVYRPMGDLEIQYLVKHNQLPSTQPYQAIIEGPEGFEYSNKYLVGHKRTDTSPSTVVEFVCSVDLIEGLKRRQLKVEDGALSMGLGCKAGKGLEVFNESLRCGETRWRIVKVKRRVLGKK